VDIAMRISVLEVLIVVAAAVVVIALLSHRSRPRARAVLRASWTLTPGVVNLAVTQATLGSTVCQKGWTRTVRPPTSYTNALKLAQMHARGLRGPPSAYQEDHLISLELGGAPVDPRNLWPEPYPLAADVDRIENELNRRVCDGSLSLAAAQATESSLKHRNG
jgi:hypothetical protein